MIGYKHPSPSDDWHRALRQHNPSFHKERIERQRGGLIGEVYRWICSDDAFSSWLSDPQKRTFWIRGSPGKGKTMLMCGLINELEAEEPCVAYFFCEATSNISNTAVSILRGLLCTLLSKEENRELILHFCENADYDVRSKNFFNKEEAFDALAHILRTVLERPDSRKPVLLVDALDECTEGLSDLLDLVSKTTEKYGARWIVSSRNEKDIVPNVDDEQSMQLDLDRNSAVYFEAVQKYVQRKVQKLTEAKKYSPETTEKVQEHLLNNTNDTFLWVALVCDELAKTKLEAKIPDVFATLPPKLDGLYTHLLRRIKSHELQKECIHILSAATAMCTPRPLDELWDHSSEREMYNENDKRTVLDYCSSFLICDEYSAVYFVHKSAKDYLEKHLHGLTTHHFAVFQRSLQAMDGLYRDMSKEEWGSTQGGPQSLLRYACLYWTSHLEKAHDSPHEAALQDNGQVHAFLREKYLFWLEALARLESIPDAVRAITRLKRLVMSSPSFSCWSSAMSVGHLMRHVHFPDPGASKQQPQPRSCCLCP